MAASQCLDSQETQRKPPVGDSRESQRTTRRRQTVRLKTKVTHLMFPKEETTCQRTTRSHHGQRGETGPTPPPQSPVLLNVSNLSSWPFLVLLLGKMLARGKGWVGGKAKTQTD